MTRVLSLRHACYPSARAVSACAQVAHPGRRSPGVSGRAARATFVDALEPRVLLAVITVTTTADDGPDSLRQAIVTANTSPGADEIRFRIPGGVPGDVHTIRPLSPLPEITGPTVIDGKPLSGPQPTHPLIELDGSAAGPLADGLSFSAASGPSTVRGLAINRFSRHGLVLGSGMTSTVEFCYVGTDPLGQAARGNGGSGVVVLGPATIGGVRGTTANTVGNVISGNAFAGIWVNPAYNATFVSIVGNNIGTDAAGSRAIGNGREGVLADSGQVHVGSLETAAPFSNLISGNGSSGVRTGSAAGSNTTIYSNYIGTDATGTRAVPNGTDPLAPYHDGITNLGLTNGFKVGLEAPARNVISGNVGAGISTNGATSSLILGNYIGTDASGTADLGNGGDGLLLSGSGIARSGSDGTSPEQLLRGNVISGNGGDGIHVEWPASSFVPTLNFFNNRIGTNADATAALGNDGDGIEVTGPVRGVIGFTSGTISNIVSANGGAGIVLNGLGTAAATTPAAIPVLFNRIGTDITGNARLGNGSDGVRISGADGGFRVEGNQISANAGNGVLVVNSGALAPRSSTIDNNTIGTNAAGTAALGNAGNGIEIRSSTNVAVGRGRRGTFSNLISANAGHGVLISGPPSPDAPPNSGHFVQGNFIGTDATGTLGLGNGGAGVFIAARGANQVGGNGSLGNVISANRLDGVAIVGGTNTSATNTTSLVQNRIQGNKIGTNAAGSDSVDSLGNGGRGVAIINSVNNVVGADTDAAEAALQANTIAFNAGSGVAVEGTLAVPGTPASADGNLVAHNSIFSNGGLGIDLVNGYEGVTPNDPLDPDSGPNRLQNFPVITRAVAMSGGVTSVRFTLNSEPRRSYLIHFYASPQPDPSGYGEGRTFLGFTRVTTDADGNAAGSVSLAAGTPVGSYVTATATPDTGLGARSTSEFSQAVRVAESTEPSTVRARQVFYNQSVFDGQGEGMDRSDDGAIATDKQALLPPAGKATFANYTTYSRGINGVMIDVLGLPFSATPTLDDFSFRVGREGTDGAFVWREGPRPAGVSVRRGAGVGGSDRVSLVWRNFNRATPNDPAMAVANGWLEVTMKPSARTNLAAPDVFSFGNLIADTGDAPAAATRAVVNALDQAVLRNHLQPGDATVANPYDFNRDGAVNATDRSLMRANLFRTLTLVPTQSPPAIPGGDLSTSDAEALEVAGVWEQVAT